MYSGKFSSRDQRFIFRRLTRRCALKAAAERSAVTHPAS
jgi:hypothetical protein